MNQNENKIIFDNEDIEVKFYIIGIIRNLLNELYLDQDIKINIDLDDKNIIAKFHYQIDSTIKLKEWLITLGQIFTKISPINKLSDDESIIIQIKEMLDISALLSKIKFDRNKQLESITNFDKTFNSHLIHVHNKIGMALQDIS